MREQGGWLLGTCCSTPLPTCSGRANNRSLADIDMPRPRVRPEQRQRSSKACNSCRASKIRCDAQLPCASCIRRDRPGSCTYPSQPSSPGRLNDTDRGQGMTPSLVSTSPTLYASSTSAYGVPQPSLQQVPPPAVPIPVAPDTDCHAHDSPRDRFLPGVNGDNGASLSLSNASADNIANR